jgi:hypothetical protein
MKRFSFILAIFTSLIFIACNSGEADTANTQIDNTLSDGSVQTSGNLNPAHGEPGHRCELAVGAPLDGTPATATTGEATTPLTITQQPAQQAIAPGMNPAHGQPGHRCDIAVGAPLNSSAAPIQASPLLPTTIQVKPDSAKSKS